MWERILYAIRECIRSRRYVMTTHAEEEMDEDLLHIWDIEQAILTGEIIERQKDKDTHEWKYLIAGYSTDDEEIYVVAKQSPTGKAVILTVFRAIPKGE